jgi:thiol-disulfide isomerase/thioredoxin
MEIKPNNPLVIVLVILLILGGIIYIESTKVQMKNQFVGNLDGDNMTKAGLFPKAPELSGIEGYINAPEGFELADVKGKVVLVDFWTYSCINCIRTLPYLTAWDEKYRDKGLVIVGVHTPEFEFERRYENVQAAVEKYGIKYPVVLDNGYSTWSAYRNRFWPHKYLIDADGFIRYDHIGEGAYEETEQMIQKLLAERDAKIQMGELVSSEIEGEKVTGFTTPELYLGYDFAIPRSQRLGNMPGFQPDQTAEYALPGAYSGNLAYFGGTWKNNPDSMELVSDAGKIVLKYRAKSVNIVAGGNSTLAIKLDDRVPAESETGDDAKLAGGQALVAISGQRLYNLVDDEGYFEKTLEIEVKGKGFKIYTFTFG